ncbi:hypothetical protein [Sedimenticola selenatireducens]|jgi:hypothetical protein|uniref:Phosphodiesterase n=1 Tax=Sedimenticola selenatireducens TaxID=191960 RepID=A0A557RUQ2_9GAMM|nr:hypothetical protein [Sedimenticola selenatireducens]TVO68869.1 hypothetical protein FHP88_18285 [Sedimenticola selenatireducens]TVT61241.1 MAG: hypothetical protein FHK78_18250 [Sedimenticola selenatireducens]
MKSITTLFLVAAMASFAPLTVADVLLIDAISEVPANSSEGLPRPRTGQTMDSVRTQFGTPEQEMPWVGEPPISRWVYADFTVYFEHEYVINTVVHR